MTATKCRTCNRVIEAGGPRTPVLWEYGVYRCAQCAKRQAETMDRFDAPDTEMDREEGR